MPRQKTHYPCLRKVKLSSKRFKQAFFKILLISLFLLSNNYASSATEHSSEKTFETRYSTIRYSKQEQVLELRKKIRGPKQAFSAATEKDRTVVSLKDDVDDIVDRVKRLLDMNPKDFHFTIYVLNSYADIKNAYLEHGMLGVAPVAFYSHNSRAIYLTTDRLTPGVLAHEIAHALINVYFTMPPPADMQEVLAQYVDKHLWDE